MFLENHMISWISAIVQLIVYLGFEQRDNLSG